MLHQYFTGWHAWKGRLLETLTLASFYQRPMEQSSPSSVCIRHCYETTAESACSHRYLVGHQLSSNGHAFDFWTVPSSASPLERLQPDLSCWVSAQMHLVGYREVWNQHRVVLRKKLNVRQFCPWTLPAAAVIWSIEHLSVKWSWRLEPSILVVTCVCDERWSTYCTQVV